ncbi:conjugal transfer protein TraB [Diaphorobacter nitroreducens]|uniref:TraB/VirB10 family protein n=1 Tax=Diaphorobacter nitroreducens TaxID=164759 RepID=UPI000B5A0A15|nr:TraB/VirB10 family protein [Diaphorobacter nitroreducens]ASI68678.1 conjugal transfer protein TraB [Diaphorobacter nitroreducens]
MSGHIPPMRERANNALRGVIERLSPRQRQYGLLGLILAGGFGLLWLILALTSPPSHPTDVAQRQDQPGSVTNIGVMPPGTQVNPVDQWVGTAGRRLAQYESERDEQSRLNKERSAFEQRTMQRFADLEQKLTSASQAAAAPAPTPQPAPAPQPAPQPSSQPSFTTMPPASSLPARPAGQDGSQFGMPPGMPGQGTSLTPQAPPEAPRIARVSVTPRERSAENGQGPSTGPKANAAPAENGKADEARTVTTFLPVSLTRGTLLGGLDAPTGGQSQSNPHPVLIRLSDNSVLPNRMRGEYRECFVIAAGYGDISSERAYLRTESLSCVRADGAALEVRIQGTVYGEDGKVGLRGRLVTKQGQMLANALLAGVVSGIGQGLATSSTEYSTSALGTVASANGAEAYKAGLGTGVGKALDRLAQYYIKLAENTFPVIEVDAAREVDVVITKGVRIDTPMTPAATVRANRSPANRYLEVAHDPDY